MLKVCRCSWMFGQVFDFHIPGYSLLRNWDCIPVQWDTFSYKILSLLIFHTENLMLLCISKPYFLLSCRVPLMSTRLGSSHTLSPSRIYSEMANVPQKQVVAFTRSLVPSLYNAGYSHPSDSSANLNRWCIYLWITDHKKEKLCTIVNLTAFGLL